MLALKSIHQLLFISMLFFFCCNNNYWALAGIGNPPILKEVADYDQRICEINSEKIKQRETIEQENLQHAEKIRKVKLELAEIEPLIAAEENALLQKETMFDEENERKIQQQYLWLEDIARQIAERKIKINSQIDDLKTARKLATDKILEEIDDKNDEHKKLLESAFIDAQSELSKGGLDAFFSVVSGKQATAMKQKKEREDEALMNLNSEIEPKVAELKAIIAGYASKIDSLNDDLQAFWADGEKEKFRLALELKKIQQGYLMHLKEIAEEKESLDRRKNFQVIFLRNQIDQLQKLIVENNIILEEKQKKFATDLNKLFENRTTDVLNFQQQLNRQLKQLVYDSQLVVKQKLDYLFSPRSECPSPSSSKLYPFFSIGDYLEVDKHGVADGGGNGVSFTYRPQMNPSQLTIKLMINSKVHFFPLQIEQGLAFFENFKERAYFCDSKEVHTDGSESKSQVQLKKDGGRVITLEHHLPGEKAQFKRVVITLNSKRLISRIEFENFRKIKDTNKYQKVSSYSMKNLAIKKDTNKNEGKGDGDGDGKGIWFYPPAGGGVIFNAPFKVADGASFINAIQLVDPLQAQEQNSPELFSLSWSALNAVINDAIKQ